MSGYCSDCGQPCEQGDKFCGACGASLAVTEPQPDSRTQLPDDKPNTILAFVKYFALAVVATVITYFINVYVVGAPPIPFLVALDVVVYFLLSIALDSVVSSHGGANRYLTTLALAVLFSVVDNVFEFTLVDGPLAETGASIFFNHGEFLYIMFFAVPVALLFAPLALLLTLVLFGYRGRAAG